MAWAVVVPRCSSAVSQDKKKSGKRGGKRAQGRFLSLRLGRKTGLRGRGRRCLEKVMS